MDLTNKENIFIDEVLRGKTNADAYRIAYPTSKKWKNQSVATKAWELRHKPEVAQAIEDFRQAKREEILNNFIYDPLESQQMTYNAMKLSYKDMIENGIRTANTQLFLGARKDLEDREESRAEREAYQALEIKKREMQIAKLQAEIDKIKGIAEEIEDLSETDALIFGDVDE